MTDKGQSPLEERLLLIAKQLEDAVKKLNDVVESIRKEHDE